MLFRSVVIVADINNMQASMSNSSPYGLCHARLFVARMCSVLSLGYSATQSVSQDSFSETRVMGGAVTAERDDSPTDIWSNGGDIS